MKIKEQDRQKSKLKDRKKKMGQVGNFKWNNSFCEGRQGGLK